MTPGASSQDRKNRSELFTLKDIGKKFVSEGLREDSKLISPAKKMVESKKSTEVKRCSLLKATSTFAKIALMKGEYFYEIRIFINLNEFH